MDCCLYRRVHTIQVRKMAKESPDDAYPAHMVSQTTSSKLPKAAIHAEPRWSQDHAEKTGTIVVHLPTGRRDGQSFSELRLESLADHGPATSATRDSLYRPEQTAGMDQAPLFKYPQFCPRVAFRMPGPVPLFIPEDSCRMAMSLPAI